MDNGNVAHFVRQPYMATGWTITTFDRTCTELETRVRQLQCTTTPIHHNINALIQTGGNYTACSDLSMTLINSGTSLLQTPLGQPKVSRLVRCPCFRGSLIIVLYISLAGTHNSVLNQEVSL